MRTTRIIAYEVYVYTYIYVCIRRKITYFSRTSEFMALIYVCTKRLGRRWIGVSFIRRPWERTRGNESKRVDDVCER